MGTARAPVLGSGAAPAWSARVSKPGSEWPGIEGLKVKVSEWVRHCLAEPHGAQLVVLFEAGFVGYIDAIKTVFAAGKHAQDRALLSCVPGQGR